MPKYGEAGNKLTRAVTAAELLTAMGATIGGTTFTQTYSTASATHSNLTAATLTDNTAGTANTTLQALSDGVTWEDDVAAVRNNFADLAASNNALLADLTNVKQVVNKIIDALQAAGVVS